MRNFFYTDGERLFQFILVLTNLCLRYMTGDTEDTVFNYASGQSVLLKYPLDAATRSKTYYLYGPDVPDANVVQTRNEKDSLLLSPDKLRAAGNYALISDPTDKDHPKWRDGFSLNAASDESNLATRVSIVGCSNRCGSVRAWRSGMITCRPSSPPSATATMTAP